MLRSFLFGRIFRVVLLLVAGLVLAACDEYSGPKELKPVPQKLVDKMQSQDMAVDAPIYIRAYKETSELEVWKQTRSGTYKLLNTYSICRWSGVLGPKVKEGDRQAPEGFYTITPGQMNPKSNYYLSFNIGFPNAYDRALGRTGTNIMVHGACSSAGCYSMTDQSAGEIYALARDAFRGGQRSFEVNLFPFRMTAENMARHRYDPNYEFWVMLKQGSDNFAVTGQVPRVAVCGKRYVFNVDAGGHSLDASAPCPPLNVSPALAAAVKAKTDQDNIIIADLAPKYEQERQIAAQKAAEQANRIASVKEANEAKVAGVAPAAVVPAEGVASAAPGMPLPVGKPGTVDASAAAMPEVPAGTVETPTALAVAPAAAVNDAAAGAASAAGDLAVASIGGTPAPGMPIPTPSPLRPVVPVSAEPAPQPAKPGFLQKLKVKLPWG